MIEGKMAAKTYRGGSIGKPSAKWYPSPSSSSNVLWERRQCSKLLCQMGRKMVILRWWWWWSHKGVLICQTKIRRGMWQCRLGDAHHPNMMWSPMASGTVQSPLVTFVLLGSSPDTVGGVGWSSVPAWASETTKKKKPKRIYMVGQSEMK
jgi:hypothetical protein